MARAKGRRACALLLGASLLLSLALLWFYLSDYMDRRNYPLNYPAEIRRFADEFSLDRYLVAAVIHVESGSDPAAISRSGALGLMQIMPDTGRWIAEKTGRFEDFTLERLFEPEVNLACGCWYLDFLLERYEGDLTKAVIAYNAGPGNLEKWLQDESLSEEGELHTIPFSETEAYVKKVFHAIEKYKELYEEELS